MNLDKVSCVYFSPTGNTKKSVMSVGAGISDNCIEYDLTYSKSRGNSLVFSEGDIVVVGMPVYGGRIPPVDGGLLNDIRGNGATAIAIVNYGNREYEDSLLEIKNTLKENGFNVIAAGAFIGEHSYTDKVGCNRPNGIDICEMKSFGESIKAKILKGDTSEVSVDGNYPYKEGKKSPKFSPKTNKDCIDCNKCIGLCPVNAIDSNNPRITDIDKCIKCCACIKGCPKNAKYMKSVTYSFFVNFLKTTCSEPKKSKLFI
ncbi:MAG: 4Fe-4S dicluster domain-containing protein [Clostridium sp.]